MLKEEVLAFGVPEEKLKEFQEVYHRDCRKAAYRMGKAVDPDADTRSAINAMLKLIKRPETLNKILRDINKYYYSEV